MKSPGRDMTLRMSGSCELAPGKIFVRMVMKMTVVKKMTKAMPTRFTRRLFAHPLAGAGAIVRRGSASQLCVVS